MKFDLFLIYIVVLTFLVGYLTESIQTAIIFYFGSFIIYYIKEHFDFIKKDNKKKKK